MKRAIDETDRRREKQRAYNTKHGITPRGIQRAIQDVMEGAQSQKISRMLENEKIESPKALAKQIEALESKMLQHAKNLEFEEAADCRTELHRLKDLFAKL